MTGLDLLIGVIGVIVTLVVGAAMVFLVPRGTVEEPSEDPVRRTRGHAQLAPDSNDARAVVPASSRDARVGG